MPNSDHDDLMSGSRCNKCGFHMCQCIDLIVRQTMLDNQEKIKEKFGPTSTVSVNAEEFLNRIQKQELTEEDRKLADLLEMLNKMNTGRCESRISVMINDLISEIEDYFGVGT